jgi:hypothetical protein
MIIGYARVTDGQSLESQHDSLPAAGADRVFAEKISGVVTDRTPAPEQMTIMCTG